MNRHLASINEWRIIECKRTSSSHSDLLATDKQKMHATYSMENVSDGSQINRLWCGED